MADTHEVLRAIPGPEGNIPGRTRVDASGWKNARLLESSGYLRRLTNDELSASAGKTPKKTAETPAAEAKPQPARSEKTATGSTSKRKKKAGRERKKGVATASASRKKRG